MSGGDLSISRLEQRDKTLAANNHPMRVIKFARWERSREAAEWFHVVKLLMPVLVGAASAAGAGSSVVGLCPRSCRTRAALALAIDEIAVPAVAPASA